jgi:ATP diphosphatase
MHELLSIMARLRAAEGCPWDKEQSFASIAPYTIEEAYEVADAAERGDMSELKDELGDLLFQVVFHAQMASESGAFDFDAVAAAICDKLLRRHPHVFGEKGLLTAAEQSVVWRTSRRRSAAPPRNPVPPRKAAPPRKLAPPILRAVIWMACLRPCRP